MAYFAAHRHLRPAQIRAAKRSFWKRQRKEARGSTKGEAQMKEAANGGGLTVWGTYYVIDKFIIGESSDLLAKARKK